MLSISLALWAVLSSASGPPPSPSPHQDWSLEWTLLEPGPSGPTPVPAGTRHRIPFGCRPSLLMGLQVTGATPLVFDRSMDHGSLLRHAPASRRSGLSICQVLVGPDGREQRTGLWFRSAAAGSAQHRLPPGERGMLPLFEKTVRTLKGRHELWVEVRDSSGRCVRSPSTLIEWTLPERQSRGLRLELRPCAERQTLVTARFVNEGPSPLSVMRPRDGSRYGLIRPYYWLSVTGPGGESIPLGARCARYGGNLDPSNFVRLAPGQSWETCLPLPAAAGRHRVQLHYVLDREPRALGSLESFDPPATEEARVPDELRPLYFGVLSSKPLFIDLPGAPWSEIRTRPLDELAEAIADELVAPTGSPSAKDADPILRRSWRGAIRALLELQRYGALDREECRPIHDALPVAFEHLLVQSTRGSRDPGPCPQPPRGWCLKQLYRLAKHGLLAPAELASLRELALSLKGLLLQEHQARLLSVTHAAEGPDDG